jgi:uncharacterized protein YcbX
MKKQKIVISGLNCYPVKSCGGIALTSAKIGPMGIEHDRQWMVVNEHNVFVAQRGDKKHGAVGIKTMCLIKTELSPNYLILRAPEMKKLLLPIAGHEGAERLVRVWDSVSVGIDQGDRAATWFTEYLSKEVPGNYRLVRMPDEGTRKTELGNDKVAFADGYPFLLTSEETLASLNNEMAQPLPMNRFRPNIVIKGGPARMESTIGSFKIGKIGFTGIKRCVRCLITTIDQSTAIAGKEPLKTLATFDSESNEVFFGMNLIHEGTGTIRVGDELQFS